MKKLIFLYVSLLFIFLSCENVEDPSTENNNHVKRESHMFEGISSMFIDNGFPTDCENNILVFPNWETYSITIDKLDDLTESYCDDFDNTVPPNITDDEYDVLADLAGFDEDNILKQFEEELAFCSLRRKLLHLEAEWLDQQNDGAWNPDNDPDNHFIDDDNERALLSEANEVIIGNKKDGYVIYKFLDDIGSYIEIHNFDFQALQLINQGHIPLNNPNVVVVDKSKNESTDNCKDKVKQVQYHYGNENTRIKSISKVRREWAGNQNSGNYIFKGKIKAKTKGYKRKNGKWKCRRTWITAGIDGLEIGSNGVAYDNCNSEITKLEIKEKRRRKVKVKTTIDPFVQGDSNLHKFGLKDNMLYSLHKQYQILIVNKDFYDMPID